MKKLLNLLMLLVVTTTLAQIDNIFISISIDPKMAIEGPGYNYDIDNSLNLEFTIGWEESFNKYNGLRVSHKYEIHNAIKYSKATWLAADYMLKDHLLWFKLDNFNQYAGLEVSTIYREDPNFDTNSPDHYILNTTNKLTPGANFEIQYNILDNFSLGIGFNVFRAEQILIVDGKNIRTDTMVSLYLKI